MVLMVVISLSAFEFEAGKKVDWKTKQTNLDFDFDDWWPHPHEGKFLLET